MTHSSPTPTRLLHTMLRVRNLDLAVDFYIKVLGMKELRRATFSKDRFTLVFLGYDSEATSSVVELTHNWDESPLTAGNVFGHIAFEVEDFGPFTKRLSNHGIVYSRPPGPMKSLADDGGPPDNIAFIRDPDGNSIELIEMRRPDETKRDVDRHPLYYL